jgi:coniferyl-aldehyde dehydrogenase
MIMSAVATTKDETVIKELARVFKLQKAAFLADQYPTAAVRIERMERIPAMLKKNRARILAALDEDFGGHSSQAGDLLEIVSMIDRAQYNAKNVKKWMRPTPKAGNLVTMGNAKVYLKSHPKGVIGNMVSWNFPFDIGLGPTLDALAAGNRVIIKPSDLAPACGKVLAEIIAETFDEDLVAVVNGGLELAKHFPTLPWDHLVYTGSGTVGKLVMAAAAKNLVPVTLELGGKSPVIIHKDAINPETIASIAGVKAVKRGQMCVTADYCLVHRSQLDTFVEGISQHFSDNFGTDNNGAAHTCGIISQRHLSRLQGLVKGAESAGAKVINTGADMVESSQHMPFHIVVDPPQDIALMQEEIFGPILPVVPYDSIEEAIDIVNAGDIPLGLYLYANDNTVIDKVCNNTRSGGVAVNVIALQAGQPSLAFGGAGSSGMGVHHGEEGFREFSNQRGYFIKKGGGVFNMIMPPYGPKTDTLINDVAYAPMGKQALFALKNLPSNLLGMLRGK